ncbi:hypothetical protein ICW40_16845, partial [Actinotalea ferrariae]|uniref:DUF7134 domain-containing protein n=1 Tax=Actinotalea ferrariae TaxID=1386098 RepID=UPI001C8B174F
MGSGTDVERSAGRSAPRRDASPAGLDAWVRARPWLPDAGLAVALGVAFGTTSIVFADGAPGDVRAALVVAVVALHLAVAGRRTWPRAAYAVCCAAMLVLVVLPDLPGDGSVGVTGQRVPPVLLPSSLAFTVLLYSAASRTRHPWPALALGSGLVGAALATARLWRPEEWAGDAVPDAPWRLLLPTALVAVVLAAWGLG